MSALPLHDYMTLFAGNMDAVGTEEGGALRRPDDAQPFPWLEEQFTAHLWGAAPIGTYPLSHHTGTWQVHWGCVDFDEGEDESFVHANNVRTMLNHMRIRSWVERSRSKGYHVWVFANEWVPAELMRHALLGACQVVDAPTKEINPKSVSLQPGQLGNYVRLPYPGVLRAGNPFPRDRRTMVDQDGVRLSLHDFVNEAVEQRTFTSDLESLAALYEPPQRFVPPVVAVPDGDMYKRMNGLAYTIFKDGPKENMGRGHTLFKLACVLIEAAQHTHDEVLALCLEADQRWGKFHHRANGEAQVYNLVERAYGR